MKIEKGIPIPVGTEANDYYAYLEKMEIGDSVVMTHKQRNNLYSYVRGMRRRKTPQPLQEYNYKFISRTTKNGEIRVWLKEKKSRDLGDSNEI